ncbi:MAG: alpha/beta fold hydrolase [Polyangiaceae bacterium]|nr:alpha/beta fold hydrolase [Polyangiaceae bacterium]
MSIAEFTTTIDGLNIHYCHAGDTGPVVVLLHGGGIDSARLSWELLIPELAHTHRVFAPDFPGYGESDKPADLPYTLEYLAAFAIEFLDVLRIERCSLVGISMGGAVAMSVALDQPERVEKLVWWTAAACSARFRWANSVICRCTYLACKDLPPQ